MKKKKGGGEGANWMDTYGDMVTLLLCFFVLLYSMSTISEENWKAIVQSFNPNATKTPTMTTGAAGPDADSEDMGGEMTIPEPDLTQAEIDESIEALYQALVAYASQEGMESTLSVTKGDGRVYVTFHETTFFNPDDTKLRTESYPVLDSVSAILDQAAEAIDEVRIQGHTARANPGTPNSVTNDRTISAMRAANVLIYIQNHTEDLNPAGLISEGRGEWSPVESNDTAEGRAANRRVELIISGRNLEEELAGSLTHYTTVSTEPTDSE